MVTGTACQRLISEISRSRISYKDLLLYFVFLPFFVPNFDLFLCFDFPLLDVVFCYWQLSSTVSTRVALAFLSLPFGQFTGLCGGY